MLKVQQWLESLNPDDFTKSNTTSSVYYLVNGLRIRVADHISHKQKECDLQILVPINQPAMYVVCIKEGLQILGFTTIDEMAGYINAYALTNKIRKTSAILKDKKRTKIDLDDVSWSKICDWLYVTCPSFKNLSKRGKAVCKELFATGLSQEECLQLIQEATSCTNADATTVREYFTPYL